MFNRTLALVQPVHHVTERVHEHVTIHRAATCESVKLLKEMERAAQDKIVEAIKVGDTKFECVIHQMIDAASHDRLYRAVFSLNGTKMTADYRARGFDCNRNADLLALRDAIAREIASHILCEALHG